MSKNRQSVACTEHVLAAVYRHQTGIRVVLSVVGSCRGQRQLWNEMVKLFSLRVATMSAVAICSHCRCTRGGRFVRWFMSWRSVRWHDLRLRGVLCYSKHTPPSAILSSLEKTLPQTCNCSNKCMERQFTSIRQSWLFDWDTNPAKPRWNNRKTTVLMAGAQSAASSLGAYAEEAMTQN